MDLNSKHICESTNGLVKKETMQHLDLECLSIQGNSKDIVVVK
jgi:hypothetical protein